MLAYLSFLCPTLCPHAPTVIGHVGRFSKVKNHDLLIEIFRVVKLNISNSKLVLIGDGPLKDSIKQKVVSLNLDKDVIFIGYKDDVYNYFQMMDIFVLPSLYEGFGTVCIEAQAAGLKCVVSNGVPQSVIVTDLISHLPLSDTVDCWAENIIKVSKGYSRINTLEIINDAGYNVDLTTKFLQNYYLKSYL